ncbi:kelch-like protein 42 [Gouania willdenowi]|uniref:BTB domain-containing protein n=1 Tax=Gouania willdenowi TaxID=441366 RepID=A0A8C5D4E8_GOUWI|nr:kelch-like protein 42 [Gouania willdenowi]
MRSSSMSSEQLVAIVTDEKTYEVEKKKLIEQSDYFRALFGSGMKESIQDSIRLHGLSGAGLDLVLDFINTSEVQVENQSLEDLMETASFLQVTSILKILVSEIRPDNCVDLFKLSEIYGTHDLRSECLRFMSCDYHPMLRRSEFGTLPPTVRELVLEMRLKGSSTLVAIGDFTPLNQDVSEDRPWSMLTYSEVDQRWKPLSSDLPPDMLNVRGFGSAVLDNYLFIAGGYRVTSQEISAVHCYNANRNQWNQMTPLNQKRSNFKLLAVRGKLYAVGGQCLSTVECYSPETDWWTFVSPMPDPLVEFSACECQGMIYVMGGYTARDRNTNVLRYCPSSDAWTVFGSCSTHIRKQQMLSVEETIYLVGGYTHELQAAQQTDDVLTVQSYDVGTGCWRRLKENTSKWGLNLSCSLHNDGVFIMSRDVGPSSRLEHRVFLKYNIFSDAWEAVRRFPAHGQNMLLCSLYLPQ